MDGFIFPFDFAVKPIYIFGGFDLHNFFWIFWLDVALLAELMMRTYYESQQKPNFIIRKNKS
jgi:hypothetical protein